MKKLEQGTHLAPKIHIKFTRLRQCITKSLVVYNFTLTQKFYWFNYIRVIHKSQYIIISYTCFLLCCKIFVQVGNCITFTGHACCIPWKSACRCRIYSCCMIYKICGKARIIFNLFFCEISCQLMYHSADHLEMPQFFNTCRGHTIDPLCI